VSNPLGKTHQSLLRDTRGTFGGHDGRKSTSQITKNTSALRPLTRQELMRECQIIVLPIPIKEAAEQADTTPRAIENVRNGESGLSFLSVCNMARANPRVRGQVMKLLGCEGETDPDFVQGLSLLMNSLVRKDRMGAPRDDFGGDNEPAAADLFGGTVQ
jgi:hypothetical protein